MADRIALTGLKVRGNHGVFDHEKRDGQDFTCDVTLWLDFGAAAASDDLDDTVDYGAVAQIAHDVIAGPARDLIETVAVEIAEKLLAAGKKFIDFGADIRFRDAKTWEKWYHLEHPNYEMTKEAVYCIPEIQRDLAKGKSLISNPGCYPTATTLGLYPVVKEGMVVENTIIVDAKSGYTGAGRRPAPNKLLTEATNNFCAYALGGSHRHTPEIEQNIAYIQGRDLMKPETWQFINFQPHLTPQIRGIEVTIYATLNKDITNDELFELYQNYYKDEPFVRVFPASKPAQTKWTAGTNMCCMTPTYDARTKRLLFSSVIDNIGKGAAGQAIQNMNIIFDLPETTGLLIPPMYP